MNACEDYFLPNATSLVIKRHNETSTKAAELIMTNSDWENGFLLDNLETNKLPCTDKQKIHQGLLALILKTKKVSFWNLYLKALCFTNTFRNLHLKENLTNWNKMTSVLVSIFSFCV